MATVSVTCLCGRNFEMDAALAGTSILCPTCNRRLIIPDGTGPEVVTPDPFAETIAAPEREAPSSKRRTPAWLVVGGVGLVGVALVMLVPQAVKRWHEHRVTKIEKQQSDL